MDKCKKKKKQSNFGSWREPSSSSQSKERNLEIEHQDIDNKQSVLVLKYT